MSTRFKSVLAQRSFRFLIGTTTIDALGARISHMLLIALIALARPGKVLAYSEGSLIVGLPPIIFAPFIGVLVDRWNRRQTLLFTHVAQTAFLLLAPLLFLLTDSLVPAWVVLFLFFTADIFKNSSAPALLPAMVERDNILTANSLWFAFARAATVAGMIGGGYLVGLTGWKWSFGINGMTHLAAGLLVLGIPATMGESRHQSTPGIGDRGSGIGPEPESRILPALARSSQEFFRELREVIVLVGRNRYVAFVMFTIIASLSITGIAYSLLAFVIQQTLNLGTRGVGIYSGILAGGMFAGSLLIGIIGDRLSRTRVIILGVAIIGVLFLAGPWLINIWFMGVLALIAGVAYSWIGIAQTAILQTRVAEEIQGRIFATREFFSNVVFLGTTFLVGVVSLVTRLATTLIVVGLALLALSAVGYVIVRGLDESGDASATH